MPRAVPGPGLEDLCTREAEDRVPLRARVARRCHDGDVLRRRSGGVEVFVVAKGVPKWTGPV